MFHCKIGIIPLSLSLYIYIYMGKLHKWSLYFTPDFNLVPNL